MQQYHAIADEYSPFGDVLEYRCIANVMRSRGADTILFYTATYSSCQNVCEKFNDDIPCGPILNRAKKP